MNKTFVLVLIQFVLFAVIGASAVLIPTEKDAIQWALGGIGAVGGAIIGLLAITEHGRVNKGGPNVVPTPNQNADLITSGLYKRIRHPIYTGVLLVAFGITIWHGHVITMVATIFLVGLLTYKSLYEEEMLMEQYPDYGQYRRRTGRFFPKLGGL